MEWFDTTDVNIQDCVEGIPYDSNEGDEDPFASDEDDWQTEDELDSLAWEDAFEDTDIKPLTQSGMWPTLNLSSNEIGSQELTRAKREME